MGLGDLKFYLRGRINRTISRALNARRAPAPLVPAASFDDVLRGATTPLALSRLLEGRDNDARQATLARYLAERKIPFTTHRFATFEGRVPEGSATDRTRAAVARAWRRLRP